LFYELIDQIKDVPTLTSLSVQAWDKYYDSEEYEWIENNYKWSKDIKCDEGLAKLGEFIEKLRHIKELDLNLSG
jgi:hypothetical protein